MNFVFYSIPGWTLIIHVFVCYANYQTLRTECCLAERISAHVLESAGISRLLDTCLFGIHNANYIVNSIVCAVILVHGSRVPAYRIWPTHGAIHILDMYGTGTKHIVRHSQKSGVQWSVISEFTCIRKFEEGNGTSIDRLDRSCIRPWFTDCKHLKATSDTYINFKK